MNDHEEASATHAALTLQLRDSIERLRRDIAARSDPVLEEVARALELVVHLSAHAHEHALSNRSRIEALENQG